LEDLLDILVFFGRALHGSTETIGLRELLEVALALMILWGLVINQI
jgi:hypothetical protein